MKQNYKMTVSYDGTRYYGWEHQPDTDMTIQGKLENVLMKMTGEPEGEKVKVIGAGRTDAGVHARAMTCNAILDTGMGPEEIRDYLNRYLPEDISVNDLRIASERFHSRYMAKGKTYRYTYWYGNGKPVFDRKYVTVLDREPDFEKMKMAAALMKGMHDYRAFCGNPRMKKSTIRVVDTINIEKSGSYIRIYFHGNGFLQNMVRIMAGTLLSVGYGETAPEDIPDIIESRDRRNAAPTAPAQGLTLMKVDY